MRGVLQGLLFAAGAYLALCLLLFAIQRSQIYFPAAGADRPGVESMRVRVDGVQLKVWVLRRAGPRALLYFGGNAEDVVWNLPAFQAAFPDQSLFLANYRGYGGSEGRPTERALLADATAIYDRIRQDCPEISVVGRSLGSGVAVHLAGERDVQRLALVSPFDSLVNVAKEHYAWLPVGLLMLDRYDSAARAPRVRAPVLIVIAGDDEVIPVRRSRALAAVFPAAQVTVTVVPGATHNSLDAFPQYLETLAEFLRDGER